MGLRRLHIGLEEQNHRQTEAGTHIQRTVELPDILVVAGSRAARSPAAVADTQALAVRSLAVVVDSQGNLVVDRHSTVDWDLILNENKKKTKKYSIWCTQNVNMEKNKLNLQSRTLNEAMLKQNCKLIKKIQNLRNVL